MQNDTALARFWAKIDVRGEDDCWEWHACRTPFGYGKLKWEGRYVRAHRIAYELEYGVDPGELCVLHRCDNPPCCNARHLFLGTRGDNAADRTAKGRTQAGKQFGNRHAAKLSAEAVSEIREIYARGGISQKKLGQRFGITQSGVWWIVSKA